MEKNGNNGHIVHIGDLSGRVIKPDPTGLRGGVIPGSVNSGHFQEINERMLRTDTFYGRA